MAITSKICGITTAETAQVVAESGASHIGFMFYPPSKRYLPLVDAPALSAAVPGTLKRVGVFVDADDKLLEQAIAAMKLDVLQLHGTETPERVRDVKAMFGKEVMKAVPVATRADIAATQAYAPVTDRVLFDAKVPGDLPGGTGQQFDWHLLDALPAGMLWGLCGGLSPENVATAIRETGCDFVDVSSGVEDAPGVKSPARIAAFMAAVRTMQA